MNITTIYFALFISTIGFSQVSINTTPAIQWQKNYGVSHVGIANCIKQTTDGGYIVAGTTSSNDGDVINNHEKYDIWIVKLNESGNIQWQKTLGGSDTDEAQSIQQTSDGGYIIAGYTSSTDGDVTNKKKENIGDYWVIKLDPSGNIEWQKVFGGDGYDRAESVQQTVDGGYIVAGLSKSNFGKKIKNLIFSDNKSWILKLDKDGIIQWQKVYEGQGGNAPKSIQQTQDKGYIMVGYSRTTVALNSQYNFYVVKFDENGNIQWQKSLGGTNNEEANSVLQTKDGGYIIAGNTNSIDGDVINIPGGTQDFWIVKLNSIGKILWQKAFGETVEDDVHSVQETEDGGYILAGNAGMEDVDAILIKLNDKGDLEWQKSIGGSRGEQFKSVQQTKDKGYIACGFSHSTDGDLVNNTSDKIGFWIVKLDALPTK